MAKAGRPKKKLEDLPKGWESKMLEMYSEGCSDVEIKVEALGCISDDLWYRLIDEEPKFSGTVKAGKQLSAAWWEKKGRVNLENKEFSSTLWYMNMKNRFGWKDKQENEITGANGGAIKTDNTWTIRVVE
jgi:hypothetical protein